MNRAFISQPMTGHSEEEVAATRKRAETAVRKLGYEPAEQVFAKGDWCLAFQLQQLGEAYKVMSGCDLVYLCSGWRNSKGCRMEELAAWAYGIKIMEEPENGEAN